MASPRDQLLITLSEAASQQPEQIKAAEERLKQWEIAPEFYSTLLDIIFDRSIDVNIRFLGAIFFKNGVDRYWRKTSKHAINPDEKVKIRNRLLSFIDEAHNQLATQCAVIVSKIARFDYPNEWPELLQNLLSIIHSTITTISDSRTILIQKRALLTLHLVVKALCSKTMGPDRKMLQEIAPELLRNVAGIYVEHTNRFFTLVSSSKDIGDVVDLETSLSALKCIRRLVVYGFKDISKVDETKTFFLLVLEHLQKFHALRNAFQNSASPSLELIDAHITLMGKFYIELLKTHPISFIMTPGSVDVIQYYWKLLVTYGKSNEDPSYKSPVIEKYLIQALLLLKSIIRKSSYNHGLRDSKDQQVSEAMRIVDEQILTPNFVESCAELLISNLIILRKDDLIMWEEDPEGWINYDESDHWEHQLRPCAEKVFMDLLSQYRDTLSPKIVKLIENVAKSQTCDLMLKDAVYCAVGLGAHELYDELDFDSWLVNNLLIEVANNNPNFKIIRRRIAWVIGRWVCVKVSKENRPKVYDAMTYLINPEEDLIGFVPYLDRAVTLLTRLIGDVEQFESRMRILNCLSLIVERMEELIAPFAEKITNLLPPLWQAAHDEHLFKPAILLILTKLVQALRVESVNLHEFIIPIIQYSVDPSTDEYVYLLEEALDLWLAILENSMECTPLMFSLVPAVIGLIEYGTENFKKVLKILESYIVLVPEMIAQSYCHPIMDAFTRLLGDLNSEACRAIIQVIDIMLQTCPFQTLSETMIITGLLWKLLNSILSGSEEYPYVIVSYISILARIVIIEPQFFIQYVTIANQQYNLPQINLIEKVLEVWLDKFDNIGHPKQRKLNAMAFATIITTTNPTILGYLQQFIGIWCDVLSEIRESGGGDTLVYWQEEYSIESDEHDDTPETKRRRALLQRDPIHTTNLIRYIRTKIAECEAINGGSQLFNQNYIRTVDSTLLGQLICTPRTSISSQGLKMSSKHSTYSTRNIRYLRISEKQVLPLILYLKPEHINWFNDIIFQEVLSALQKLIPKKFSREKKKFGSDIYREGKFQFAYYFKNTDVRHSVLEKNKKYVFPSEKSTLSEEDESSQNLHDSFTNEKEEDEKPTLQVTYQGFNIFYKSLIVIVEPPGQIIEFGDNVKVASAMTIDDYLGQDDSETDVGSN
ncbi:26063_t:CDS:10, partial [Racocetra persica]